VTRNFVADVCKPRLHALRRVVHARDAFAQAWQVEKRYSVFDALHKKLQVSGKHASVLAALAAAAALVAAVAHNVPQRRLAFSHPCRILALWPPLSHPRNFSDGSPSRSLLKRPAFVFFFWSCCVTGSYPH